MFLLVGYAIIISLAGEWSPSPATGADFSERVFIMSIITLCFERSGVSIGEVTLKDCAQISNAVTDLALAIFGIRNGMDQYTEDLFYKEWVNVSKAFNSILGRFKDLGYKIDVIDLETIDDAKITVIFD